MSDKIPINFLYSLRLFSFLSKNMRVRDRVVKVVQYGCQMMMGYYGTMLSEEMLFGLKTTRRTASTSRKAFWLLKWIHHINETKKLTVADLVSRDVSLPRRFDILQQLSWVVYFYYENLIFLARTKLFGFEESKLDYMTNLSWLVGDTACFLADLTRLYLNQRRCYQCKSYIESTTGCRIDYKNRRLAIEGLSKQKSVKSVKYDEIIAFLEDLQNLEDQTFGLQLSLAIVSIFAHSWII
jgi:hypothetical protein